MAHNFKLAIAAMLLACVMTGCAAQSPPARYQLGPGGNQILDTNTGELFAADFNDGKWEKQIAPAASAKSRPASVTQPTATVADVPAANRFPNAVVCPVVEDNLRVLAQLNSDGVFAANEYAKARANALAPFDHVQQLQLWNNGPERLHDELGVLKQMRDANLITSEEYERIRSSMVQSYVARE